MYTGEEFEQATENVAIWLEDIRDEDVSRLQFTREKAEDGDEESAVDSEEEGSEPEEVDEESEQLRLRVLDAEEPFGPDYRIFAEEGQRYFRIQSEYMVWEDIAEYLSLGQAEEFVNWNGIEEDHYIHDFVTDFDDLGEEEKMKTMAAFEIIDDVGREEQRELVIQLVRIATNNSLKHYVSSLGEAGGIPGFAVFHKIFPYEDGFHIDLLNRRVEQVRMGAHMGETFLKYAFQLPVDLAGTTGGDVGGRLNSHLGLTEGDSAIGNWREEI